MLPRSAKQHEEFLYIFECLLLSPPSLFLHALRGGVNHTNARGEEYDGNACQAEGAEPDEHLRHAQAAENVDDDDDDDGGDEDEEDDDAPVRVLRQVNLPRR